MTAPSDLDRLAARAFVGAEEERLGGWLLRSSPGEPPLRVNSALPVGPGADVATVEAWYAARGAPARIVVSPEDELAALDDALAGRGWSAESEADVLVGDPGTVLDRLEGPPHAVVPAELTGPPAALRSRDPVVQLGAAGGAGRATVVLQDGWCLMLALEVASEARRQGIGAAIVRAWARLSEGRGLYLQVRRDNAPGHALYAAAGFTRSHGYHYRTLP